LDFIGIAGKAEEVVYNQIVLELLANASGTLLQRCTLQAVRCQGCSQMLMFAKLGDYLAGLPVGSQELEEWQGEDEDEEEPRTSTRISVLFTYYRS